LGKIQPKREFLQFLISKDLLAMHSVIEIDLAKPADVDIVMEQSWSSLMCDCLLEYDCLQQWRAPSSGQTDHVTSKWSIYQRT